MTQPELPNNADSTQHAEGEATNPPVPSKKPASKAIPDWQPLGTVRDYFNEQMKQDQFR